MRKIKLWLFATILTSCYASLCGCMVFTTTSCTSNDDSSVVEAEFIPNPPDYNNSTLWVSTDSDTDGTGADIFYVVSTWEEDWLAEDGRTCHYADVWNPLHREHMGIEIKNVAAYMSPGNRFFAPYYRHTTIEAWMTKNEDFLS